MKKKASNVLPLCVCVCVCVKLLQLCLTLCNPIDYSFPGSAVHGVLQSRILEWIACPPPGNLPNPGIEPMLIGRWKPILPLDINEKR